MLSAGRNQGSRMRSHYSLLPLIAPAGRGKSRKKVGKAGDDSSIAERHGAMTWAQLKRVFNRSGERADPSNSEGEF